LIATTRPIFGSFRGRRRPSRPCRALFDLVAAEHRLFRAPRLAEDRDVGAARRRAAAEHHRLGELLRARQALLEVAELRVEAVHVAKHALGLVELALALEIEREVVQVVHQRVRQRHLAELVPCHVELAPGPGRQARACGSIPPSSRRT
jgi:hypothetical protein